MPQILERINRYFEQLTRRQTTALRPQIVEALKLLSDEGINEATPYQIRERVEGPHPATLTGLGPLYNALEILVRDKVIARRKLSAVEKREGTFREHAYAYRILPPAEQTPEQPTEAE
jgi:hypothetical protein